MARKFLLSAKHMAGGFNGTKGETHLSTEENIESRNMEYTPDGAAMTSLGYAQPVGWTSVETNKGIDGMFVSQNYPNLIFKAVNGKIKQSSSETTPFYNVDTALTLTPDNRVLMREYRGNMYFANGVEDMGRVAIGTLYSVLGTTPTTYTHSYVGFGTYTWTASGSGTNEYYLRDGSADPRVSTPVSVTINAVTATQGTPGTLAAGRWGYGDNDTLGYSTVYVRLSDGTDPDTKSASYVMVEQRAAYINAGEGSRFRDTYDKIYIEGDEIDYTDELDNSNDDLLLGITNVSAAHVAGAYLTQYNTLTPPTNGSLKAKTFAFFRDTLWYAPIDEPNVLRYSKTVASIGTIGNVNDFSDGNNYLIGEGGHITALHSTRDRIYAFTSDKTFYVTTEINSSGLELFSKDRMFTPNYGCANPYCVCDMEDVTIFFSGRRLIRIGYQPNVDKLLPDEKFDEEIFPILAKADADQSKASLFYNSSTKKLFLSFSVNGVLQTIVYNNRMDKYAYNWDHDTVSYAQYHNSTFFGDRTDDNVWKFGLDLDGDGTAWPHVLKTGRWVGDAERYGGRRKTQRYVRGVVSGKMATGTIINFTVNVNGRAFGGTRQITDARADAPSYGTALGMITTGMDTVGGTIADTQVRNFRYPFLVSGIGEDIQFKFSSLQLGAFWQIDNVQIEGYEYDQLPYTHF